MKIQGLSPSQPPRAESPREVGWKDRVAGLLERDCGWVLSLSKRLGRASHTELAFRLFRFLATGEDENGAWRSFVITYGKVDPEQLDSFITQLDELKIKSIERVAATCRKIYNTELIKSTDLHLRVSRRLAFKTVGELLASDVKGADEEVDNVKMMIDFTWLYETLCKEITKLAAVVGMHEHRIDNMLSCIFECPG